MTGRLVQTGNVIVVANPMTVQRGLVWLLSPPGAKILGVWVASYLKKVNFAGQSKISQGTKKSFIAA